MAGYWSDGTANVDLVVSLRNEGNLRQDRAVPVSVTCSQNGQVVNDCRAETNVSLPDGYRPTGDTLTLRVPTGDVSFSFAYAETGTHTQGVNVPKRIVGVDRDVWACFSDASKRDTIWEENEGIGCGAWADETIQKWKQLSAVRVFVDGADGFIEEFKDVLNELSPVVNLQFEWVERKPSADITVYVGLTLPEVATQGLYCLRTEALGCANTEFDPRSGQVFGGQIIVYNLWPEEGLQFDDFEESYKTKFRSAMIHEAVHTIGRMNHRTELLSIMSETVQHRAELSPMDEALLRLHGHRLVRPGMTMSEIERLFVFNDELIDPQVPDPEFEAWILASSVYRHLREATSASFKVRSSSPGCSDELDWTDYEVGNLTGHHPYFGWFRLGGPHNQVYALQPYSDTFEYWHQSQSRWETVSRDRLSRLAAGWRNDLSDPHHMLESILYYADWSDAVVSTNVSGKTVLQLELDMTRTLHHTPAESVGIEVIVDEEDAILGYTMAWKLDDARCDTYRIEATDGQYGIDFTFPDAVRLGSDFIESCEVESLGTLEGYVRNSGSWARECGPDRTMQGYARSYRFSLDHWSFVRFELSSFDDVSFNLLQGDGFANAKVDLSAAGYLVGGHGLPEDGRLRWAHVPLPPGDYAVEIVTYNRVLPGAFTFTVSAQPTPPPPYRFKSISVWGGYSCGLLTDGTPLCWGRRNVEGDGSEAPGGRFVSISAGGHQCGLREDGTPLCWDFADEGEHTCSLTGDGIYCRLDNQADPNDGSRNRNGGTVATRSVGVIGGYYDQTPPTGEKLIAISAGWSHSCGLREDRTAVCWGSNQHGKASPPAGERLSSIAAGTSHSCALRQNGLAVCWGADSDGQASAPEGERFVAITAGEEHTCGLREDDSTVCWGSGGLSFCTPMPGGTFHCATHASSDQIPGSPPEYERFMSLSSDSPQCALRLDGTARCWSPYPTGLASPPENERFASISSSSHHACALRADGTAVCWGRNRYGQASPPSGVNYNRNQTAPPAPTDLVSISSGGALTCALDSNGAAVCWGPNWWKDRFADEFASISSGSGHACGVRLDGTAVCRGSNRYGQSAPPLDADFVAISSGFEHSCGLRVDGTALCWGRNDSGQASPPENEILESTSSGGFHTCGLRRDGTAVCWGAERAGIDLGQTSPPGGHFVSISSGGFYTCGLRKDGSVVCWGQGRYGALSVPKGAMTSINSGGWHACGLRGDGAAVCWGADWSGQASPPPDETFVSISSGGQHSCGLRADGTAVCWGQNGLGQASPRR